MVIIPAIDIKDGSCVRLEQGDFSRSTRYGDDPVAMARHWQNQGAERLHVVDLDGSLRGTPVNAALIAKVIASLDIPVQIGGGIRNLEAAKGYLDAGAAAIILGTVALKDPEFVRQACDNFGKRVLIGIDARNGAVALEGWRESSRIGALELAKRLEPLGIGAIIYTDISRDGMQTGINIAATSALARDVQVPVIASGGLASLRDVEELLVLAEGNIEGVVVGRALYTMALSLPDALALVKEKRRF